MSALRAVLFVIVGLPIGSFLTVLAHRVPRKESIVAPRSRCPACGTPLRARDNIPVLSYALLRGRCRHCGTRISARYPLLELGTAGLFMASALVFDGLYVAALMALFSAVLLVLSVIDAQHRILPNRIVYPSLGGFAALILVGAWAGKGLSLSGAALGFLAYGGGLLVVALVTPRGMGMGDVKLAALVGLVVGSLGLARVGAAAGAAVLLGGIGAVVALLAGASRKQAIPFGPFLAAGGLVGALAGDRVVELYLDLLT